MTESADKPPAASNGKEKQKVSKRNPRGGGPRGELFRKGGKPGPGRPRGVPNKSTSDLRKAILDAAKASGDKIEKGAGLVGYLTKLADDEPKAFSGLLGRCLPKEMKVDAGDSLYDLVCLARERERAQAAVEVKADD